MLIIGLTGGIGSGKTTVACMIEAIGYPVYTADRKAKVVMSKNPDVRRKLKLLLGKDAYFRNGRINKKKIAEIIFNDPKILREVNDIVHPQVMKEFFVWAYQQEKDLVFFESALIYEADIAGCFDYTICVTAPLEMRIQRVMSRDKIPYEKVMERIRNQFPEDVVCAKSTYIIENIDNMQLMGQIIPIIGSLKSFLRPSN